MNREVCAEFGQHCGGLREAGADLDKPSNVECTPLMAASYRGFENLVRMLVMKGCSVNKQTTSLQTALYNAVCGKQLGTVNLLIRLGADLDLATNQGATPLMTASFHGYLCIMTSLIDAGANLHCKSSFRHLF